MQLRQAWLCRDDFPDNGDSMPTASIGQKSEPTDDWISQHYARIFRAAWAMTGDVADAEDLAQETFVVALDQWDRFEGRSSDSTWLYGILIRLRRRRERTLGRMRRRLQLYMQRQQDSNVSSDPSVEVSQQQWRESIWAAVAKLPAAQRDAVTLRYAEGMSYNQIAATVGCAVGTAKTRVHHGLKQLRRQHGDLASPVSADDPLESDVHTTWPAGTL